MFHRCFATSFVLLFVLLATSHAPAREWTAKTGHTIEGEFFALDGENVLIQLPDGRMAKIQLDLLSDKDQQFVRYETIGPVPPPPIVDPPTTDASFVVLQGHTSAVTSVVFSPDGRKVVTVSGNEWANSSEDDLSVRIWDARSGKELLRWKPDRLVRDVLFSPDGKRVVAVQDDMGGETVWIWNADPDSADFGKELRKRKLGFVISVSADFKKIMTTLIDDEYDIRAGGGREDVYIWDVDSGRLQTLEPKGWTGYGAEYGWHPGAPTAVSPDGTRIVTVRGDNNNTFIQVWDADSGEELRRLGGETSRPLSDRQDAGQDFVALTALFSPDGSKIAVHCMDETVRIWEVNTGKELQKLEGGTGDFLPDGKRFATASSEDDTISIWDVNTGKKLATLEGTREVLISPDGRKIVTQSEQGAIRVWDTDSGRKLFELEDFPYCFSSDGKILIVNDDGSEIAGVRIVDAESGRRLRRLEGEFGALSHDGKRIALVSGNGVWVWAGDQPEVRPAQAEKVEVTIDNVKREITSVRLRDNETIVLNVGDLCHYIEDEKLSIPFRWAYSISDENVVSVFHDQYEYDESRSRPLPGADEGWRTVCFQAISPGECVITVRYKDIVDAYYHAERIYTVKVRIDDNLNDKPIDPQPPQPPQPPANNGATAHAENTGATISIDKTTYEPGDKIVVRYSGFTKNVFHSGNYPVIQIYDDKMPAVCDSEMFLDFISQGKDNVPSSGTVELQLPNYPGTFEVRLRFYSQELDRIVNATIPVTVKPKNDPTPQPHPAPTPQPPGGNVGAKLVGTWNAPYSSATYNPLLGGVRMVFGGVIYRFNDDGTFEYRVFTGNSQSQFTGKYTASEGKNSITLERSSQKNVMEYEYGTDNEGEYLRIGFLHEDSNDLKMFRRSKQAPEQPPNVMIDSEIIGAWSCQEYGADNTLYVYQFNADGTFFIEVRRWHWSDEKGGKTNRIDGKFTTSGGTVYLTDQVLTYDPGDNKKTEPLKNKSSAYKFGTTEILNTKYVEISVFNASNTIPDPEGLRNFYAVAELPTPQPPDRNIDAALVGVWRHTTYDVIARSTDIYLWFLNKDGTFKLALVTSRKDYFHEGNYSVSDGKIYLSNVVFTNDDYVGNKPDSQVRFVAGRDSEGKEQLEISRVLDGFAPNGTWFRINTTEDNDGGST